MHEVMILGASGYSGLELMRILARHTLARVIVASSDKRAGTLVSDVVPGWPGSLRFAPHEEPLRAAREGRIALLATPAKTSAELVPKLLDRGARVIDLSGAFRLESSEAHAAWYGFEHPAPELLAEAHYGLPELFPLPPDRQVRLIANPGCYATASILAAAPLVQAAITDRDRPLVIDGKSGTTGAGRALEEGLLFSEVGENVRPYRIARHQHTPEIERALSRLAGRGVPVSFTAHLLPMTRGLLTSVYAFATEGVSEERVQRAFEESYRGSTFVRVRQDRPPETGIVRNTNYAEVGGWIDRRTGVIHAFAAIDNLVKGAAGQAVQNLNAMIGAPSEHAL